MDGRALVSVISSTILCLLFLYAVYCATRIYIADRQARLDEDAPPRRWLAGCLAVAGRLAVGTAVLFTILALSATAASWSLGGSSLRALLSRLEGGPSPHGAKEKPRPREAVATASVSVPVVQPATKPGPSPAAVRRPESVVVWNGRVIHSAESARPPSRERAARGESSEKPERIVEREARVDLVGAIERPDRTRSERVTGPEWSDRGARLERPERVIRVERTERLERADRPPKPERAGRAERPERLQRRR